MTAMCIELMSRPAEVVQTQARLIRGRDDLHRGDAYFGAEHEAESTTTKRYSSKFVRHALMVMIATDDQEEIAGRRP